MVTDGPISQSAPVLSIIIAVYNDWAPLDACLQSLARQETGPSFEIIVIDDGSEDEAPESLVQSLNPSSFKIVRQPHQGISAARNRGIQVSRGSILLFIDADSRLQENCLASVNSAISQHPAENYFQLRLVGDCSTVVGRSEQLRLIALQHHLRRGSHIRYLNTAGFALRRTSAAVENGLFDPSVPRGEDTLLLADLIQKKELPLFVDDAVVQHAISFSPVACFRKDIRAAYLERKAYKIAASKGCRIRISHSDRLQILRLLWRASAKDSIGRPAWFLLVLRQALQRVISYFP